MLMVLSGCWNYNDVEDRTIVAGAAVDVLPSGDVLLTAETISFAGDETTAKSEIITGRGKNFASAMQQMSEKSGKELYWHHATVIIVSEEYAERGMTELFDYILNDMEVRLTLRLAVALTENARDIFDFETYGSQIKSEALNSMIEESEHLGSTPSRKAYENINTYLEGGVMLMPLVYENGEGGKSCAVAEGSALFKDGRLALWLDRDSTEMLLLLKNEVKQMLLDVPLDDGTVTVLADKCRCKTGENTTVSAQYRIAQSEVGVYTEDDFARLDRAAAEHMTKRIAKLDVILNDADFELVTGGELVFDLKNRDIFDGFFMRKG